MGFVLKPFPPWSQVPCGDICGVVNNPCYLFSHSQSVTQDTGPLLIKRDSNCRCPTLTVTEWGQDVHWQALSNRWSHTSTHNSGVRTHTDTAVVTRMVPLTVTSPVSRCCWNAHNPTDGQGERGCQCGRGCWLSNSDGVSPDTGHMGVQ